MAERTCQKVLPDGSLCGTLIEPPSQSNYCPQHRNFKRCKKRPREKEVITVSKNHRVEAVMISQVRSEFISEVLSLLKLLGFRQTLQIMFDSLKVLISRMGKNVDYEGDD